MRETDFGPMIPTESLEWVRDMGETDFGPMTPTESLEWVGGHERKRFWTHDSN